MFVNLTPHDIVLPTGTIKPEIKAARCSEISRKIDVIDGIEIIHKDFGEVIDLPEPVDGTYYIVSMLVRSACPDRKDLLSPGDLIRDNSGQILGCKNLVCN
jgi:hypothetical protein